MSCIDLGTKNIGSSGGGGGSGTVTSIDVSVPSYMTSAGGPVTTSGAITLDFANQTTNKVFAAPNGSTGAPSFRILVAADIPSLTATYATVTLNNLGTTAVNASINPATDNAISLGTSIKRWADVQAMAMHTESLISPSGLALQAPNNNINMTGDSIRLFPGVAAVAPNLRFYDNAVANFVGFKAPASVGTSVTYVWPGADGTNGQVLSTNASGVLSWATKVTSVTASAPLSSSGGTTPDISISLADTATNGYLSSTDWNIFNAKFDLPALTAASVLFSNGSTIAQDNTNFNWDDTGKTLALGGVFGAPGTVPYAQTSQRTVTNPNGIDGAIFGLHYSNNSANNGSLNTSGYFEGRIQIDVGVTVSANTGVIFQAYRNINSDAGALGFLVGAFGGSHQQSGIDAAATTDILAGVLSQVDIQAGTANKVADFYGLAGTNGGTITTGQFGIYIEPPGAGIKDNWLSGQALIGGSSYASHTEILKVNGDMSATISVTDSGAIAGIFNATSNTTVDGSNTTLGLQGVATAIVQSGVTNDKSLAGLVFTTTRGDGTDDGTLSGMAGIENLIFINSGAAGVTSEIFGVANILFTQQGDIGNYYDLYSQRNAGAGTVGNHYGVYLKDDTATPIKSWMSGSTLFGASSFTTPIATVDIQGSLAVLGNLGFFGVAPVAQQTGGAATAGVLYTATEQAMLQAAYDALRAVGILT